jgi:hypothetical protein
MMVWKEEDIVISVQWSVFRFLLLRQAQYKYGGIITDEEALEV